MVKVCKPMIMIDGGYGTMGDGKDILMQSEKCPIVWSTDTWLL